MDDALITFGSEVKDLGKGRLGGHLVLFSGPESYDLDRDRFTPATDFGFEPELPYMKSRVYYAHALDLKLAGRVVGSSTLHPDGDVGIWIEGQLALRDEYEEAVYGMVKAGKLGWSSGTAPHLVSREREEKGNRILSWPLGLDASLTPTPAEPRTRVVSLKSFAGSLPAGSSMTPGVPLEEQVTGALLALSACVDRMDGMLEQRCTKEGRVISGTNMGRLKDLRAHSHGVCEKLDGMIADHEKANPAYPGGKSALLAALRNELLSNEIALNGLGLPV